MNTAAIAPTNSARLRASLGDLLVIAGWIGGLTLVGSAVRLVLPLDAAPAAPPTSMLGVDLAVFAATVAPVGIYLTVTEAGRRQSSWGKRRVGLRVVATDGTRAGPGRIAVRNAVKLLPWQLAHIAVARLILGVDAAHPSGDRSGRRGRRNSQPPTRAPVRTDPAAMGRRARRGFRRCGRAERVGGGRAARDRC